MVTVKWSLLFFVTVSVFLFTALHSVQAQTEGHELIGPGACRGPDWSDDEWPLAVGDRTLEDCSEKCQDTEDCTAFSLGKGKKPKKPCMLYSHEDIQAASSLGGECYKIVTEAANTNDEDDDKEKEKEKEKPKEEKKVKKSKEKPETQPEKKPEKKKPEVKQEEAKPEVKKPKEKKPEKKEAPKEKKEEKKPDVPK